MRNLQQQLEELRAQNTQEVTGIRRHVERERKKIDQAHDAIVSIIAHVILIM